MNDWDETTDEQSNDTRKNQPKDTKTQGYKAGKRMYHEENKERKEYKESKEYSQTNIHVDNIIARLRQHLPYLKQQYHIKTLGIFGSYVRSEQTSQSDLDVLVDFDKIPGLFTYVEIQETLSHILNVPVDLVHRPDLKPHIGEHILNEVVMVW